MTTRTKQSAAAKAKKEAEATQPKAETVPETAADAVAPSTEQEAQANAEAATVAEVTEANAEPQPAEIQGNTVTGDGSGNALPPIEETPGVFVRTKRRIKSRRRAGHRFNREGMGIALDLLSKEQLKQLREDPALEVEFCAVPVLQVIEQES